MSYDPPAMQIHFENCQLCHLNISTQHYDFVADVFGKLLNETDESHCRFSLREMKTYDVIRETELGFCDIGILAIKDKDRSIMERFIAGKGLTFAPLLKALPHVFLRKEHPAAKADVITLEALKNYPCVSYEQGEHSSSFDNKKTDRMICFFIVKNVCFCSKTKYDFKTKCLFCNHFVCFCTTY